MATPIPTNLELLTQIAQAYGIDVSAYEKTTERTEYILLRLILQALLNGAGGGSGTLLFNGERPILREGLPGEGETIGGTTVTEFLDNYFFPALSPTATLAVVGTSTLEYNSAGSVSGSLSWTVTKRTRSITSINVAGNAITPTGESQTGTQAITIATNANNTFSILVSDGTLTDTATVTIVFRHGYYWGAMASTAAIDSAAILALTGAGVGTGKQLSNTRVKNFNGINGQGNYLVFAFPQSFGTPSFVINGLPNTAFSLVANFDFTNSLGYEEPYQVWASNTPQNSAIALFQIN